jgi:hypothetical protein
MNKSTFAKVILAGAVVAPLLISGSAVFAVGHQLPPVPMRRPATISQYVPPAVQNSSPAPSRTEVVVKRVGETEVNFFITAINQTSVRGLLYRAFPVARNRGYMVQLGIGSQVGYSCRGVVSRIVGIDYYNQTVTFLRTYTQPDPRRCPI